MTLAWTLFTALCDVATQCERLREGTAPGSDAWCALLELVAGLDELIDHLVLSDGLTED